MTLLLLACNEQNLIKPDEFVAGAGSNIEDSRKESVDTVTQLPQEECNGVDDNGNGEIDEGFPDADANGRADCLDGVCPTLPVGNAGALSLQASCQEPVAYMIEDPWNVKVTWVFAGLESHPEYRISWSTPIVGNLTDDDGDGQITSQDIPDIVLLLSTRPGSQDPEWLVAIDGKTHTELWHHEGNYTGCGAPVIADVTGDGWPEILSVTKGKGVRASDVDGTKLWESESGLSTNFYGCPIITVADLEGDGTIEVIDDHAVLEGLTGQTKFFLQDHGEITYHVYTIVADLDGDGHQELLRNGYVYNFDGSELWSAGMDAYQRTVWPAVVQADSDPEPEVLFAGEDWRLLDQDGTLLWELPGDASTGPPCVGDFDGDTISEIVAPRPPFLEMYELDGSVSWSIPVHDYSSLAGCSGFDVDGDGALEVLYADEDTFNIIDGATGTILFQDPSHSSATGVEYPTVADLDLDGHAEILVAGGSYDDAVPALTVYAHAGRGWPPAGPTWATHDFSVVNVNPDGSVPSPMPPYWLQYGVYRARPADDIFRGQADLVVSITGACVYDCTYGPTTLAWQVGNQGLTDVPAGTFLTIYAEEESGPIPITTLSLPALPIGQWLEGQETALPPGSAGALGFRVVVDDNGSGIGTVDECNETNNIALYQDATCP